MNTTNELKHTPGPWKQHNDGEKTYASVRGSDGSCVADCGSRSNQSAQSNARLIAAAPELLEAIGSIAAWLVAPDLSPETLEHFRTKARAAIAKATEAK